jgi:uncharacterized protein with gpF-like domain
MTPEDKSQHLRTWHRFQQRYERIFTTKFKAALKYQVNQRMAGSNITSEPIYKVLVELYKTVGPLWAAKTGVHRIKEVKSRMPMGFSERIVELMRQYYGIDLLNDAELITTYTRGVIEGILAEAAQAGWSIDEIVSRMNANTELGAMRARRIARTETVTAANGASIINAKETGIPMRKIWLSVNDHRTRHSHVMVDDVVAPLNEPFNVNGSLMMQPGVRTQTNGLKVPAKEVVNCRCTMGFEVIKKR